MALETDGLSNGDGEMDGRARWSVTTVDRLLRRRSRAAALLGGATAYMLPGFLAGFHVHRCPFHFSTGLPCPGCGLSRAVRLLLNGEFGAMWTMHPFAPYILVFAGMLTGAALLPSPWRERWATCWTALEARTRLHAVAWTGFVVFGITRLLWHIAQR